MKRQSLLLVLDRDDTLIENGDFFGSKNTWKTDLTICRDVVRFVSLLQATFDATTLVVSNQSGVARGYFTETRVREINEALAKILSDEHVVIDAWEFEPYVDDAFATRNSDISWVKAYLKPKTRRKPSPQMVVDGLEKLQKHVTDFSLLLVIGDRPDDEGLAKNLGAWYINPLAKSYEELLEEFELFDQSSQK